MTLQEAISNRRAVRNYTSEHVSEKAIQFLLEQAILAPSAINLQPWAFAIIQKPELLKKISDLSKQALKNDPRWKNAPGHGVLHLTDEKFNIFYGATTLIIVCAKSDNTWAAGDSCFAAQNLMLSACAMGLGTCPVGLALETLKSEAIKVEVGIPSDFTPVLPVIVGFPDGVTPKTERNPPKILNWIRP